MALQRKILVIEDDELVRNILVEALMKEGLHVSTAGNTKDGFKIASEEHPDLIVLDVMLPEEDGFSLMKKIRTGLGWAKEVPFFVFTNLNLDDEQHQQELERVKPVEYLVKANWTIQNVAKKIKERLAQ